MTNDLFSHLKTIQKEAFKNSFDIVELKKLRQKTEKYFNKRINQLASEYDLVKKIEVPKNYIKLWKCRKKQVQIPVNWRYLASSPFIYGMVFPSAIWHICIEIYHQVCFRLYGIPLINYRDYFIFDRKLMSFLNPWEKINCIYCSYVNNLIRYSAEIGGRTERYWCPIKYYRRIDNPHSQYDKFVESKNPKKFRKEWEELRDFSDLK